MKSLHSAERLGAIVAAGVALLPGLSDFFIVAYVAGAFAAVWFAIRVKRLAITFKEGAHLGFVSGFYGVLAASGIYDFVWHLLHYQLWKIKNADRIFRLLGEAVQDIFRPSFWLIVILQIILIAICAGAFGVPAGIFAVRVFRRRTSSELKRP